MMKRLCLLLVLLPLLIVSGCVVATKDTAISPEIRSLFEGKYKVTPYMENHVPKTVAVLPFVNAAESQQGSQAVRRGFYNHFASLPFKDMELYRVDSTLEKTGLTDPAAIAKKTPQELGNILGTEAVIYGDISNFDKMFAVMYSQVAVGAKLRMYDTKSGELLWTGEHTVRIHEGGVSLSPIGIVATIVATSMNVRDIQLLRACDDLFREMVKTIPTPTLAEALRPPVISLLVQDTKNLPKKAGDEIRVVIQGTPKMQAYFDIGDYKKHIDMQEQPGTPGVYLGTYKVLPGDNVRKAILTGYLRDDSGNVGTWVDAVGAITLKTTPPDKPAPFKAVGRNNLVLLSWGKSKDPDLAGYRLYRSLTPLSGFVEIAKTEVQEYRDAAGVANGTKYYYLASAVDLAGNESERTPVVGIPVAPGPTPVKGNIEADTVWYSGASPYVLSGKILLKDKAALTIEPGTEIRGEEGGSLIVEGTLRAEGDAEGVIAWDAAGEGKTWGGVIFNNVKEKENLLRFNRFRNARIAVACQASSPKIESSEFSANATGIRVTGAFSKPLLSANTLAKNTDAAIVVTDGAAPLIQGNRITENAREGVLIRGAAPVVSRNLIQQNGAGGISVLTSQAKISENSLLDNKPFNLSGAMTGAAVDAVNNWWGTDKGLEVLKTISGRVDIASILTAPYPAGKALPLPILGQTLGGPLTADGYLTLSGSPYRIAKNVVLDNGATLYVEPGVVIKYDAGTALIVENGGIIAKGTADNPIVFTASGTSPAPGFYASAVRFAKSTKVSSALAYVIAQYADIAFDVVYGAPEIAYALISKNATSGIYCRNDAAPIIAYSTLISNRGEGAITCVGSSRPKIHHNNLSDNDFAIQARSSLYIDARNNWWGKAPPDMGMIMGDTETNINIKPWLTAPEKAAFGAGK